MEKSSTGGPVSVDAGGAAQAQESIKCGSLSLAHGLHPHWSGRQAASQTKQRKQTSMIKYSQSCCYSLIGDLKYGTTSFSQSPRMSM
jgi:hypothetical protein